MLSIIRYIFYSAVRDKLFIGLALLLISIILLSLFFGNTALVEESHMGLVFMAGSSRLLLVIGFVIFICFNINRA